MTQFTAPASGAPTVTQFVESSSPAELTKDLIAALGRMADASVGVTALTMAGAGDGSSFCIVVEGAPGIGIDPATLTPLIFEGSSLAALQAQRAALQVPSALVVVDEQFVGSSKGKRYFGLLLMGESLAPGVARGTRYTWQRRLPASGNRLAPGDPITSFNTGFDLESSQEIIADGVMSAHGVTFSNQVVADQTLTDVRVTLRRAADLTAAQAGSFAVVATAAVLPSPFVLAANGSAGSTVTVPFDTPVSFLAGQIVTMQILYTSLSGAGIDVYGAFLVG